MKNFFSWLVYTFIFLAASDLPIFAQPQIDNASGTVVDQSSIVINGESFGSNSAVGNADLQWLGDNIEDSSVGDVFAASGWDQLTTIERVDQTPLYYTNAKFHSRDKSLKISFSNGQYASYIKHDHGLALNSVYVSYWVFYDWDGISPTSGDYQTKQFRINKGPAIDSGAPLFYNAVWTKGMTEFKLDDIGGDWTIECDGNCNTNTYYGANQMPGPSVAQIHGRWCRMEYWLIESTNATNNGTIQYWFHDPGGAGITNPRNYPGNIRTTSTGTKWQIVWFGTYWSGTVISPLYVYWDDIFVQVGTQARVELGDASTWYSCIHREIQIPMAWSNNSITVTFNQGSFNNGDTVYLYVVDENGNVNNNGFPITIGQGTSVFDLNSDGKVDSADVQACVDHILGTQDYGTKADANADGVVNILDVQLIVNAILGS